MARFRDFFRRVKKHPADKAKYSTCTIKVSKQHVDYDSSLDSSSDSSSVPAAYMQISKQGTYFITHTRQSHDTSIDSGSSKTAVEENAIPTNTTSVWKSAAKGTQYDKREELTEEDEEMWARLAM